ncbi:aminoglycoside phosphotransferase family protein [Blastococcus tunisiensis]|uniref:aminoglycoside phosphotransferase family protein n=1 Tax=Blastococcus tunisiensis TaxID=1798228 RepID=UPI0015878A1D|nr:aminoglycoside phosphotransferase family protein [Blastococcus sp. DSM 46838]
MTSVPAVPVDRWPDSLRLLLAEPARGLWSAVLGPLGGRLQDLRPRSVSVQPDGAATVQFSAGVVWSGGRESRESLVAATGSRIPHGADVLERSAAGRALRVGVWRWPSDPALPGLAWAASAREVGTRLAGLVPATGGPRLRLRSYRPGRRAVIEARYPDGPRYLKVVPPSAVDRLVARHELLAGPVPAAPVLTATADGVLVLPGLPGTPLRALLSGEAGRLPSPEELERVLDALPSGMATLTPRGRRAPADGLVRAGSYAAVLGLVSPELRPRLDVLTAALAAADPGVHEPVPVHGDFYESQLLVDDGAVVGLLDVDTAGCGHRIDDWATLLAHLVLLEQVLPDPAVAVRYAREIEDAVLRRWPAEQVRPRVAAVLLGLATGPFRVQQPDWPALTSARLALAEEWAG